MENLTYGQKLVGLTFNPSGDPEVIRVKQFFADLIDTTYNKMGAEDLSEAFINIYVDTITNLVTAQMWAVKMLTWKNEVKV